MPEPLDMSSEEFIAHFPPLRIVIANAKNAKTKDSCFAMLLPREFRTGSLGWFGTTRLHCEINDRIVPVSCQFQIVIEGTKKVRARDMNFNKVNISDKISQEVDKL